jgi:hypothetical protein
MQLNPPFWIFTNSSFLTRASGHKLTYLKVKVKDSRNRTGVVKRVPGGLGSQIFMTFGT